MKTFRAQKNKHQIFKKFIFIWSLLFYLDSSSSQTVFFYLRCVIRRVLLETIHRMWECFSGCRFIIWSVVTGHYAIQHTHADTHTRTLISHIRSTRTDSFSFGFISVLFSSFLFPFNSVSFHFFVHWHTRVPSVVRHSHTNDHNCCGDYFCFKMYSHNVQQINISLVN